MAIAQTHVFSPEELTRLWDEGALNGMPVELIEGVLVDVSPQEEDHVWLITRLTGWFAPLGERMRIQLPLVTEMGNRPEPDVAIATVEAAARRDHATTALLVVEVSVTTHRLDRLKAGVYARAGVERYWQVDVPGACVFEHTGPTPNGYDRVVALRDDELLDPQLEGIAPRTVAALLA